MRLILITLILLLTACAKDNGSSSSNPSSTPVAGPPGAQGPQGDPGPTGVTAVKFCPNLGGGNGYPESGLIIDNAVYALYYAPPTASISKITPGNYVTTDGRSCNFTITVDGKITNQTGGDE